MRRIELFDVGRVCLIVGKNQGGIAERHAMFLEVLSALSSSHSKFSCSLIANLTGSKLSYYLKRE